MNLAGLGSGAFDAAFSAWSMNEEQKYNTQEAHINREFQKEMSNTAYQRAVKDLNAAGLSPMLAYSKGGASAPTGATAGGTQGAKSDISGSMERGAQSELLREQVEVAKSQKLLNESTALKAQAEAYNVAQQTSNMGEPFLNLNKAQIDQLRSLIPMHGASAEQMKAMVNEINQKIDLLKPEQEFKKDHPTYSKYASPVMDALGTIFKGIGAFRNPTINTTTTYPDGSKSTKTTTRGR